MVWEAEHAYSKGRCMHPCRTLWRLVTLVGARLRSDCMHEAANNCCADAALGVHSHAAACGGPTEPPFLNPCLFLPQSLSRTTCPQLSVRACTSTTIIPHHALHMQAAQLDEEDEEPEEASCMVCKEGYKSAPGKLLGCYVYCKRVAARSCPEATAPGTDPDHMVRGCKHRAFRVYEQAMLRCKHHSLLRLAAHLLPTS